MSPGRALCWLGPALVGRLSEAVSGTLAGWTSVWGLPPAGLIHAEILEDGAEAAWPSDLVDLLAPPPRHWLDAIARALFPLGAGESVIVDAVIRRMAEQLQQRLQGHFPRQLPDESAAGLPGHRGVLITSELLGLRCRLQLGIAELREGGWLKCAALPALPALNLERAVGELPVPLVAELGRASVSVNDLMQLAPGDVLLLEESLDAPLRVGSPGCSLALSAHLGSLDDPPRRAARWLAA